MTEQDSATESQEQRLERARARVAEGSHPWPEFVALENVLERHGHEAANVIPFDQRNEPTVVFDFGPDGDHMEPGLDSLPESAWRHLKKKMNRAGARFGVGRYNEDRDIYRSPLFVPDDGSQPRTIHLVIDLFADAGTEVRSPFDASIHSFQDNASMLDYGPTIVLKHKIMDVSFYTLFGHLDRASLHELTEGDTLQKGEAFARIGPYPENGNWAPHLHFQIIADMLGKKGDFPGVAAADERLVWLKLCPDPNKILHIPQLKN
jgi:murein DD-endopeptidase MepM/ murein hydrolase activator NlpD